MTLQPPPPDGNRIFDVSVNVVLRLAFLAGLIVLSVVIIRPFGLLLLWAVILAVALSTPFEWLARVLRGRGRAAVALSLIGTAFVAIPTALTGTSLVETVRGIRAQLDSGTLEVAAPSEALQRIPVIGQRIFDAWTLAHADIQRATVQFGPQLHQAGEWAEGFLKSVGGALLLTLVALYTASAILAHRDRATRFAQALARRIAPGAGSDHLALAVATINSVTLGVIGVAAIQAIVSAILFRVVDFPAVGLMALVIFVAAVVQLPTMFVMVLPIGWGIINLGGLELGALIIGCILIGIADTPLKAVLLGRGLPVPTFVILVGAIGGMVSMGMMGLFVGAVVLGLVYRLLVGWTGVDTAERAAVTPSATSP